MINFMNDTMDLLLLIVNNEIFTFFAVLVFIVIISKLISDFWRK